MLIDHIGTFLYPFNVLRIVGRLAFPLFAYQLVIGYRNTNNKALYLRRLIVFAFISQLPFYLLKREFMLNILFTLALGLITIWAIEKKKFHWFIFIIPAVLFVEYGIYGISMILIFYLTQKNIPQISLFFLGALLYSIYHGYYVQLFSVFSFFFILGPKPKIKLPKHFFYLFYPIHLALIYLIKLKFFV